MYNDKINKLFIKKLSCYFDKMTDLVETYKFNQFKSLESKSTEKKGWNILNGPSGVFIKKLGVFLKEKNLFKITINTYKH